MNAKMTTALFAALMLLAAPAWADWDRGDPYKMHYPQLPDPLGWDVSFLNGALGDDWMCTGTGTVDDFHLWVSFRGDRVPGPLGGVFGHVEIWDNVPAGGDPNPEIWWSHPGNLLWGMPFDTTQPNVKMRLYESGEQGWLEPGGTNPIYPDHSRTYQINIDVLRDVGILPFVQKEGDIYWLVAHMTAYDETPVAPEVGWKTTLRELQFMDDAVYTNPLGPSRWLPLEDPFTGDSLDLAFVITTIPEPATVVLLMLGVVGALAISRRAKK